ncbi:MAG: GNAT family N-acetyltransferase, partial [Pseudoalteromonas prydzensis]
FQGRGVGSAVITHVIAYLKQLNINYFWCDARTTASSFYQQFGMDVEGPAFDKAGVQYYKMSVSW